MKTPTLLLASVLATCALSAGCQEQHADNRPGSQYDIYSSARLETAPLSVRSAFRRDYPDVTVSDVETRSPQDGPLLYVITFYQGGRVRSATYTQDGTLFRIN